MKMITAETEHEFDLADELAALNAFRSLKELLPDFWQAHWQRAMYISAVVGGLASESDDLRLAMGIAALTPDQPAGKLIRFELNAIDWEPERKQWFLDQLSEGLFAAYKLAKEPGFPEWLDEAKRIVNAGFIVPE